MSAPSPGAHFHHESFFHAGDAEFLAGTLPFVCEALSAQEPVLVAVSAQRIELLRDALGAEAQDVAFADMRELGSNPARIIPEWRRFLDRHAGEGGAARGIGEPIWKGRSAAELTECERHEALLNVAFSGGQAWRLMCPYDLDALDDHVIETARSTHPFLVERGQSGPSDAYATSVDPFSGVLPAPPAGSVEMPFTIAELAELRGVVSRFPAAAMLEPPRADDLILAVTEMATNSVCHGGGAGILQLWVEDRALVCEVRDSGHVTEPLAGRVRPVPDQRSGRGLWLINHLCDLTQIRSAPGSTTVRVHMNLA